MLKKVCYRSKVCFRFGYYFRQYACWNVEKNMCVDIFENVQNLSDWHIMLITALGGVIVILWTPRVCTNSTQDIGSIAPTAICYMDHTSIYISVNVFENAQSSCDWQKTYTTASRGLVVISWKPGISTIRSFDLEPIASKVIWYMDHNSIYMRVEIFDFGQSSCDSQIV